MPIANHWREIDRILDQMGPLRADTFLFIDSEMSYFD